MLFQVYFTCIVEHVLVVPWKSRLEPKQAFCALLELGETHRMRSGPNINPLAMLGGNFAAHRPFLMAD